MEPDDQQATPPPPPEDTAQLRSGSELNDERREPLPRVSGSDRLLWAGAALALLAHVLPFVYLGKPDDLGEGVLTEAIAVELVDKAVLEGKDQTPLSRPAAAAPPPKPAPPAQAPSGPPQKPQQAVPPSPPPAPAVAAQPAPEPPRPKAEPPPKAPAAFDGEDAAALPTSKSEAKEAEDVAKPAEQKQIAKQEPEAKPRPPTPQRPPPQTQAAPQAPPAQPSERAAPPIDMSLPGLAKSGEVSKFAKQVVAALAKAKPNAPGIKGKVTVTVVVAFGGGVRTAKVTGSSGRADLDKLALEAAKKAKLPTPPADVTTDDLFYDVEYQFK